MTAVTYTSYGRKMGFNPLPDKKAEFEALSKKLFSVNSDLRFHAFHDPAGMYDQLREEKQWVLRQLEAVSKPSRKRK